MQRRRTYMFRTMRPLSVGMAVLAFSLVFGIGPAGMRAHAQGAAGPNDAQIQTDVQKALDKKEYKDVHATVQNGNVTLQGTVDIYSARQEAEKRVHHVKKVSGVDNQIQVAGPAVEDAMLRNKLAERIANDRVGYGTTVFNAITIGVQNGVVTLGGTAYGPPDKDSALSLVANTPGVKDIVDKIDVAPLSPMDDRLRVELARVI